MPRSSRFPDRPSQSLPVTSWPSGQVERRSVELGAVEVPDAAIEHVDPASASGPAAARFRGVVRERHEVLLLPLRERKKIGRSGARPGAPRARPPRRSARARPIAPRSVRRLVSARRTCLSGSMRTGIADAIESGLAAQRAPARVALDHVRDILLRHRRRRGGKCGRHSPARWKSVGPPAPTIRTVAGSAPPGADRALFPHHALVPQLRMILPPATCTASTTRRQPARASSPYRCGDVRLAEPRFSERRRMIDADPFGNQQSGVGLGRRR